MNAAPLLAHQGGWDEILLVVGPLAVVAGLLWLANKRVTAQLTEAEGTAEGDGGAEATGGPAGPDRAEADDGVEGSTGTDQRP